MQDMTKNLYSNIGEPHWDTNTLSCMFTNEMEKLWASVQPPSLDIPCLPTLELFMSGDGMEVVEPWQHAGGQYANGGNDVVPPLPCVQ